MFGLRDQDISCIVDTISRFEDINKAIVFDSRALGNYKKGSDIDIAVKGEKITKSTLRSLSYELNEESLMPYKFDIISYNDIKSKELIKHIDEEGKVLYIRYNII